MAPSIGTRLIEWLGLSPAAASESESESETEPGPYNLPDDERKSLPDGYRDAEVRFEAFDSPTEFDAPVPNIACLACAEPFGTYWEWYNHGVEVHEFASIEEARRWGAVIVPTEFDGNVTPDSPVSEMDYVPDSTKPTQSEANGDDGI